MLYIKKVVMNINQKIGWINIHHAKVYEKLLRNLNKKMLRMR